MSATAVPAAAQPQHRVVFDLEIDFSNGGGLQGRDFRLDIKGSDMDEAALADDIVRDMRLLEVGRVRILRKRIVVQAQLRTEALA